VTQLPDTGSTPSNGDSFASWLFIGLGAGLLAIVTTGGVWAARVARRRVR
jgi:hypothetical protein